MELIFCISFSILFFLLAQFAGGLIFAVLGLQNNKRFVDFFFRLFVGICLLVFAYEFLHAGIWSTIPLMLIPGIIIWFTVKQKRSSSFFTGIFPPVKWLAIGTFIVIGMSFYLHYFFESFTMQQDSAYYLKISESLRLTGMENTRHFRNIYSDLLHGVEPYHYFELWLAASFMDLSGGLISHLSALRVCSYGLILSTCVMGLIALCETIYGKVNVWHLVLGLLFLFFIPNICQYVFNYEKHFNYPIECNPINRLNFRTYWMFLMPLLILGFRKEYFLATISVLLLPCISITTAPAILATVGFLFLSNRWTKFYSRKEWFFIAVVLFVFALGCFVVLSMFKIKNVESMYSFSPAYIIDYFKSSWKAVVYFLGIQVVNLLVVFGPFLVLTIVLASRIAGLRKFVAEYKFLLLFVAFVNIAGIVIFQGASFMNNAYQFAFIGYCSVCLVLFVLINALVQKSANKLFRVSFSIVVFGFLVFSALKLVGISRTSLFAGHDIQAKERPAYSQKYLNEVRDEMKTIQAKPGAFISDSVYYNRMYYSKRLPDFYFPGLSYYIFGIADNSYQFCLSDTSAIYYGYTGEKRDLIFLHHGVASSLFYQDFFKPGYTPIGEKRKMAIGKYGIRYIIMTPGAKVDEEWSTLIERSYTDKQTGQQFLVLRQ
jgi:hypothetical protein